ncbi:uncharacterized protein BDW43DRAFT_259049, partial [Aspergillus alliaceus]|uniref:uncharacterized protein n=1 Tax=Petromyces alliaceus TaxID=209559 RepID=UPI0012A44BAD
MTLTASVCCPFSLFYRFCAFPQQLVASRGVVMPCDAFCLRTMTWITASQETRSCTNMSRFWPSTAPSLLLLEGLRTIEHIL